MSDYAQVIHLGRSGPHLVAEVLDDMPLLEQQQVAHVPHLVSVEELARLGARLGGRAEVLDEHEQLAGDQSASMNCHS